MPTDLNQVQRAFATEVQTKVTEKFSKELGGTCETVNYDPGFHFAMQFGPNAYYNAKMLNDLDQIVRKGTNNILTMGTGTFSAMYQTILGGVAYGFSNADRTRMQREDQAADAILLNLITQWETANGPIPTPLPATIFPSNKAQYVMQTLLDKYGADSTGGVDIDKIPDILGGVRSTLQDYRVAAAFTFTQRSRSAAAMKKLAAAKADVIPTASNGGFQTGATTYGLPYTGVPVLSRVLGSLNTDDNKVEVKLSFSGFSGTESQLKIGAQTGFTVDLGAVSFGVTGGMSYALSKYAASGFTMDMTMTYPGITIIGSEPMNLSTDLTRGWFSGEPAGSILSEVLEKSGKDATGYQYQGGELNIADTLGKDKAFGRLKTLVICREPTISMTYKGGNASSVASDFKQNASVSVKLFGLFTIGSASQSYEVKNVDSQGAGGGVTVTTGPTKVIGTTPTQEDTVHVLAGVRSFPPVS